MPVKVVVPSHGPVHLDERGLKQTSEWLRWLATMLENSAAQGLDLSEVLRLPVPTAFRSWAAQPAELQRTIAQWYPAYEARVLTQPATATDTQR